MATETARSTPPVHQHDLSALDASAVPVALARLHAVTSPDDEIRVRVGAWPDRADGDGVGAVPSWEDIATGAGFSGQGISTDGEAVLVRRRTLPDTVGPDMALLVVGLNPSVYSADAGVGFARPGNRFWPAAVAAGLVEVERDTFAALEHHGIGMTDLVKRATPRSAELDADEYREGFGRLQRLCAWLRPGAVCMVGLEGWRAAVDRRARAGVQELRLGERPVYVMGSTSGLNAHQQLPAAADHLRAAAALAAPG